jgi:hypothetical protein
VEADVVTLSSEFPNDNPAMHRGVIRVCLELTSAPTAEPVAPVAIEEVEAAPETIVCFPPRSVAPAADDEADAIEVGPIVIEELEVVDASVEGAEVAVVFEEAPPVSTITSHESSVLPPCPDDPFTVFVCTLADVAIGAGSPHVASFLPGLMFDGRLPDALDDGAKSSLRSAGLLDGDGVHPAFVATACAWRAILRGTSDDFSACGSSMLDEWASDLLARLLEAPAKAPTLRQELRSRGVAAFGLVEVAA